MFYYAQQLQRSARVNAVLTRVCRIIKCPFQQESVSPTSSLGCASYWRPRCCGMQVTLVETPCSEDVHSPWVLLEETATVQDTTTPLPALHLLQMLGNPKHWHPTWTATLPQPLTAQKQGHAPSPWSGTGALQQIHGVEGSQQWCFKKPKSDALDDLYCSPALAWQLYFWLNCIFSFANVGSGNTSGETWPQLRMRSFATHFPWGQHFAHFFFKSTPGRTWSKVFLFVLHRRRYSNTGGYQKGGKLCFHLPSLTHWI